MSFPLKNKIGLTDGSNIVYGKNVDITIRIVLFLQTRKNPFLPLYSELSFLIVKLYTVMYASITY